MHGPFQFLPKSILQALVNHPAIEDVQIGSPSRSTEIIITLKDDQPICKHLAPKALGGLRVTVNHYSNGMRINWKDAELNFQYVEFVGSHLGMSAVLESLYADLMDTIFMVIDPPKLAKPYLGEIFVTQEDFRKLQDDQRIMGFGVSPAEGRTSLMISIRPGNPIAAEFMSGRATFEILFDATSVCFRWYGLNEEAQWDSISASSHRNLAVINAIFSDPIGHMVKLLKAAVRADELSKSYAMSIASRRHAALRAQFETQ